MYHFLLGCFFVGGVVACCGRGGPSSLSLNEICTGGCEKGRTYLAFPWQVVFGSATLVERDK